MSNSLESFKIEIQKLLSEAIVDTFRLDPKGSVHSGQLISIDRKWGTIVRIPGKNTPVVKILLATGDYINYIETEFESLVDQGRILYIR